MVFPALLSLHIKIIVSLFSSAKSIEGRLCDRSLDIFFPHAIFVHPLLHYVIAIENGS